MKNIFAHIAPSWLLLILIGLSSCKKASNPPEISEAKVIGGVMEKEYSYAVMIDIGNGGKCSGSFLTPKVLLTAAHCVLNENQEIMEVLYNKNKADLVIPHESYNKELSITNHDIALVKFRSSVYSGNEFPTFASNDLNIDDPIVVVGFGLSIFKSVDTLCVQLPEPVNDQCLVNFYYQDDGIEHRVEMKRYTFPYWYKGPRKCTEGLLKNEYDELTDDEDDAPSFNAWIDTECAGVLLSENVRHTEVRPGRDAGKNAAYSRRSGTNKIASLTSNYIRLESDTDNISNGDNVATAKGDSGGPLFVLKDEMPFLAGITSAGKIDKIGDNRFSLTSWHLRVTSDDYMGWLRTKNNAYKLEIPQLQQTPATP